MRTILIATFMLICLTWSPAQAATKWATPFVFVGPNDTTRCVVTNQDKKVQTVQVQAVNVVGADQTLGGSGSTCTSPLNPGWSCHNDAPVGASVFCFAVTDSSKVRVNLEVLDAITQIPRVVVPATKQ